MEYLQKNNVLEVLKFRSRFAKQCITQFEQSENYTMVKKLIYEEFNLMQLDDDPYYLGFLYSILIRIYLFEKDYDNVVNYVNKIMEFSGLVLYEYCGKLSPFSPDCLDKILKCYDKLISEEKVSAMWGKARILHFMNDWKKAHSLYKRVLEIDPNNSIALRMYGRLFEDECKYSVALDLYEKVRKIGNDPTIDCFIANVYVKLGNFDCAIKILNDLIINTKDNTIALFRLYNAYCISDQRDEAKKIRNLLLEKCPYNTKYILYTTEPKNEENLSLYKSLKESLDFGFNYSVVERFIGDYNLSNKKYEASIEFYQELLKRNPVYPPCYSNMFVSLMNLTKNLNCYNDKIKNYENFRYDFMKLAKQNIPNDILFLTDCENADKILEERINAFETKIKIFKNNINFYLILFDLYKEEKSNKSLSKLIHEMKTRFPESYEPYLKEFDFNFDSRLYKESYTCLEKICVILNLKCNKKYEKSTIKNIMVLLKFYINPDNFQKLESEINGNEEIYKDLISLYFNLSYKDKKYVDIAYDCIKKSKLKNTDKDSALIFIKSLLYAIKGKQKESQEIFNTIFSTGNNITLIDMIQICEDVFDISYLHDLFVNNSSYKDELFDASMIMSNELKELYFYQNLLLYLLHSKYIKDNPITKYISHYTSTRTLSALLDDKNISPLRLYTLNSANDLKEGKVLLKILSSDIKDINIIHEIDKKSSPIYCSMQTSFSLLEDALTMFRLYGKDEEKEGTGVNLVFRDNFFNDNLKTPLNNCKLIFNDCNTISNLDGNNNFQMIKENEFAFDKLSLYFVLYYDKNKNILIFNPFDIYSGSVIDLNKKKFSWTVINQTETSLIKSKKLKEAYLNNIAYVFYNLKNIFSKLHEKEIFIAKNLLLNINYLVKDVAFVDEKELRMISINGVNDKKLIHDSYNFSLYKNYMTVLGDNRYNKKKFLKQIVLGPKVEQKETVTEYFVNHLGKIGLGDTLVLQSEAPLA